MIESLSCPNCGAPIASHENETQCKYCGVGIRITKDMSGQIHAELAEIKRTSNYLVLSDEIEKLEKRLSPLLEKQESFNRDRKEETQRANESAKSCGTMMGGVFILIIVGLVCANSQGMIKSEWLLGSCVVLPILAGISVWAVKSFTTPSGRIDPKEKEVEQQITEIQDRLGRLRQEANLLRTTPKGLNMPPTTSNNTSSEISSSTSPLDLVGFDVILQNTGRNKLGIIKEIRLLRPELGLAEAKTMAENPPCKILESVSREVAERAKSILEAQGAVVAVS